MKKLLIILSLSFVLPFATYAQLELDYEDDINPYFLGDSVDLVFPLLYDFFKYNNDHPATNIQLALIFEDRYKNAHPISDYEAAIANAERAELLFGRSRDLIDDRETRRNAWYYPNFTNEFKRNGKPVVEFDSVKVVFYDGLKEADSFLTHMPPIHTNFMKMVEQYDLATKNFVRINGDYNSLKDVYLLYDDKLESRFNLVKNSYDSTLYYFKKYQEAAKEYPPFDLEQEISINKIKTYRLDGLVIQTDFLVDNIGLWDYGAWVDQVKKVIDTEINLLRKDIVTIEKKLDDSFAKMENWEPNDSINLDPIEKKSIYKIRKYDLNSPVANVFQYKDDKLDLISEQKSLSVYDTAEDISFQVKLYTINRVFQQTVSLENDLKKYNSEIPNSNLNKNKDFYQKYYGGIDGIKSYFKTEEEDLLKIRSESAEKLRLQILDHLEEPFLQEVPTYRGVEFEWQMPEYEYDPLTKNVAFINHSKKNVNDLEYFGGFYFDKDSVSQAFYGAKVGNSVKWYNAVPSVYSNSKVWQKVPDINVVGGGDLNFLVYESHVDSLDFVNRILVSDENGEIKNEIEINTQEKPIELTSLRNSNFQLAFYQGDGLGDAVWPTNLTAIRFHPDSSDYFIKEVSINGKYNGVFQTEAGLIVTSSSEDKKNIYVTIMDNEFNALKKKTFSFEEEIDIKHYYQVSDESLHLFNAKGEKGHLVFTDQLELRYSDIPLIEGGI
ncbi:hypothetical protein QYS49_38455 [Marivirga salinae]|uniref:Uncharacterized protein n=1 Tax=Marivirga salinarum TaxID=3059078 RepID=A0AA51NAN7_9BACT|nr:hypothetical protein [Marivirga sp. BDSF4-3]WMN11465.1 hypothetical protein QYS49_38455 [Marivirga sp. BDSF4-3]